MTCNEFSDQFDTLLNSYNIQAGFGEGANKQGGITLDEYEKSVLLTQAQDIVVKSYFDKSLNNQGQGMDDSTRRQVDFSSLIKVKKFISGDTVLVHDNDKCYDDRGLLVTLDNTMHVLFILNEKFVVDGKSYVVVPINYKEYDRAMSKAYAQPLKKQAWRLFSNTSTGFDIKSEIIPSYGTVVITQRSISYVSRLSPNGGYYWAVIALSPAVAVDIETSSYEEFISEYPPELNIGKTARVTIDVVSESAQYIVRYVERPTPIILRDLPDDLNIDGTSAKTECILNPSLHIDILNKAFELAVTTRGGGTAQRSSNEQ